MRINRLHLVNFRQHENTEIEFGRLASDSLVRVPLMAVDDS